jgi:hypothetical protein
MFVANVAAIDESGRHLNNSKRNMVLIIMMTAQYGVAYLTASSIIGN